MKKQALIAAVLLGAAASVVAVLAASAGGGTRSASAAKPITLGISLSLSGDFSDPGKAARRGYDLWQQVVNAHDGILGRKVKLKIVDDASSPNQAVTNYTTLITRDHVDLVFGPFSTLLTAPSARVASRYGYAFVEPAGGGPAVFQQKLSNVFFAQPAPIINCGDPFVHFLSSLPKSARPSSAAYPALDDPFASPIAARMRGQLKHQGIKSVFSTIYPPETKDYTPIVAKMASKHPQLVAAGTQSDDAYALVKAMIQLKLNPRFLFLSNGASSALEFPDKVGRKQTEGIFSCGDWIPQAKNPGNKQFVAEYLKKYGGNRISIDSGSAEAYAVGQIIQAEAAKTHSIDNKTIIKTLHKGSWPTVEGRLSWNKYGAPQGSDILVEWIHGKLVPVWPKRLALHKPTYPKPHWR
jgi:branched-chain amino acid transport system substrate-binding protein